MGGGCAVSTGEQHDPCHATIATTRDPATTRPRSAASAAGRGARGAGRADHSAAQAGHGASAGARQRPASQRRPGTCGIDLPSQIEHVAADHGRPLRVGVDAGEVSRPLRGQTRHSCHGMQSSESQLRAQMPCSRSWAVAALEGWVDRSAAAWPCRAGRGRRGWHLSSSGAANLCKAAWTAPEVSVGLRKFATNLRFVRSPECL